MGFNNPGIPWSQLEGTLSGRPPLHVVDPLAGDGDGGDSPAWSRRRPRYEPPPEQPPPDPDTLTPYAELHCHTNFSFLDGASHPEEMAEEAGGSG